MQNGSCLGNILRLDMNNIFLAELTKEGNDGFDEGFIRSAKQDDNYGASNIVLPCPGS
jgi:hypothetical protein